MKKVIVLVLVSLFLPSLAFAFQPLPIIQLVRGCTDSDALNYNPNANQDDGSCIPKVYGCTNPKAINYNSNANVDDESCGYGGVSFIQLLPKINQDSNLWVSVSGKKITVSFLATKFSYGAVLVSQTSHPFPVNVYGYPSSNGWAKDQLGENYGYDYRVEGEGFWTYHLITFEVEEAGTYYLRPMMTNGGEVLGQEMVVVVN